MADSAAQVCIYYRVRASDLDAWLADARSLHAEFAAAWPGLRCSLGRREEDAASGAASLPTVMETYTGDALLPEGWRLAVQARAASRLQRWAAGERHSEVFLPCA